MTDTVTGERRLVDAHTGSAEVPERRSGGRRRLLLAGSVVVVVAALAWVPLPLAELAPGPAVDVAPLVTLGGPTHAVNGRLLLTTVAVSHPSAARALVAWLSAHHEVVTQVDVVPSGVTEQDWEAALRRQFDDSARIAAAVGLSAAGYPAAVTGGGARIVEIARGGPADGTLEAGDVVTAVDGRPVHVAADLGAALAGVADGHTVTLTVARTGRTLEVPVTARYLEDLGRPGLGVALDSVAPVVTLPFPVSVNNDRIGGPSAGLMLALTVYDLATDHDLARGRAVAGTGTLDGASTVGPIGGIADKVVGARKAGATVFLAPAAQAAEARAAAGPGMTVIGVTTFADAVDALTR